MSTKETVLKVVLENFPTLGRAPATPELTEMLETLEMAEVSQALVELERDDAIVREEGTGRIIAAYPYSDIETSHCVIFGDGVNVWAMCALDALGIHFMTKKNIIIESTCPQSGTQIKLRLENGQVTSLEPAEVTVWLAERKSGEKYDAITSCPGTNFFSSREALRDWKQQAGELKGQQLSLLDAIERSIRVFGHLLK